MIAFDNGPPNGDYVRYIDGLMERAALAAAAVVRDDRSSGLVDRARDEQAAAGPSARIDAVSRSPGAATGPSIARPVRTDATRDSGFATPTAASPAAAAASAIASALLSGQVGRRATLGTTLALAAIVAGVLLAAIGLLWQPLNLAVVIGGIALFSWAFRRLVAGAARRVPDAPTSI